MQIRLSKTKTIEWHFSATETFRRYRQYSRYGLFFLTLLFIGSILFLGRQYLYGYQWTDEKKKEYRGQYFQDTSFREERFRALVDTLLKREALHQEKPKIERDLFLGTKP
jgi:hypothetical protein